MLDRQLFYRKLGLPIQGHRTLTDYVAPGSNHSSSYYSNWMALLHLFRRDVRHQRPYDLLLLSRDKRNSPRVWVLEYCPI